MAESKVQVTISAKDQASSVFKKVGSSATDLAKALSVGIAAGGAAVAAGLGVAVNAAAGFEKQMSAVKAVSGATAEEMAQLSGLALKLGKDTSFSASEAARGLEELVKGGVEIPDIMNGAAQATLALAEAGGVDLASAAEIASNALNTFNLSGADMAHVADMIAGAANSSAIDVNDFRLSMAAAGAVTATVGGSFDDLSVAIAAMGNAGIKGSDAGTSLKTMLLNLQPTTKQQIELFKELGLTTADGSNKFFDAQGKLRSFAEVSQVLQDALRDQTEQQKLATLETLFGSDAIRAAAVFAKEGAAGFEELATKIQGISAAEVASTRLNNLAGDIEQLKGSAETAAITLGQAFQAPMREATQALTGFINNAVIPFIEEHGPAFAQAATDAARGLATGASSLLEGAKKAASEGLEVLRQKLGEMGGTLAEWASEAGDAGKAVGDALSGVSGIALSLQLLLQGNFRGAMEEARKAFDNLGRSADSASKAIDETRAAIERLSETRTVLFGVQQFADNLNQSLSNLGKTAEILVPGFLRAGSAALDAGGFFNLWNAAIAALFGPIARLSEGVLGMSKALLTVSQAADIVAAGLGAFASVVGETMSQVGTAVNTMATTISTTLSSLAASAGAQASAIGAAIVNGVVGGITSRAQAVASAAASMVTNALQAARNAIEARSPSVAFMRVGLDIGAGLTEGIEESVPEAEAAAVDMGESVLRAINAGLGKTKLLETGVDSLKGTLAGAMRDLASSVASIQGETTARFAQIGEKAGQAFNQAIIAADSAIRSAVRDADRRIGEMVANLALNRQIRGLRDAFGAGQDEASRARSQARETEDLTRDRQREDQRRALELQRELERAKTAEERAAIMDRFAEASEDLVRRRKEEDEDRAYRRQREAEDRAFRRQQDKERQDFEDRLEDDALARSIKRAEQDRDERIKSINDALDEKQRQIKQDAEDEKKKLIEASADKIKTLKEEFIGKLPPLTAEAQNIIDGFLNGIDQALEEVRNTANAAIEAIANIPREVHVNVITHHSDEGGGDEGGGDEGGGEEESFAHGGVVSGPAGAPRHILAHGGETVVPTGGALGAAVGGTVNVYVAGNVMTEQDLVDAVHSGLLRKERSNAGLFRT